MKKAYKIVITLFLTLLILIPAGYFLLNPIYTDIKISFENIDLERFSQDSTLSFLTTISPYKTDFGKEKVLGATTIEESLVNEGIILERKILEELNTKLSIQDIHIDGKIYEGESAITMDEGFWHFPLSVYPGKKGNAVIIGHRFKYVPPNTNTFYNLDKLRIGDEILVSHDEGKYTYIVVDTHIAEATDTSVLEQTEDYRLTLITCTPLWTSEKRLVITAKLDKLYKKV